MIVFLDSTVLKSDKNRCSYDFAILTRLVSEGGFSIHMSEINYKEMHSFILDEFDKVKKVIIDRIENINNFFGSKELEIDLTAIDKFKKTAISNFDIWIDQNKCEIHRMDKHYGRVFESYFKGGKPFSSLKNRSDIPDGFVFEALADICSANNGKRVAFISQDKKLFSHVNGIGVLSYENLKNFIESEFICSTLKSLDDKLVEKERAAKIRYVKGLIKENIEKIIARKNITILSEVSKKLIDCRYKDYPRSGHVVSAHGAVKNDVDVKFNKSMIYINLSGMVNARIEYDLPSHRSWTNDVLDFYDEFHHSENWTEPSFIAAKNDRVGFSAEIIPSVSVEELIDKTVEEIFSILENSIDGVSYVEISD